MKNYVLTFLLLSQPIYSEVLEFPQKHIYKEIPSVSSQRLSSAPYLSGDTFRSLCDFVIDKTNRFLDPKAITDGDAIFIAAHKEFLDFFFQKVHPKINAHYILVTHNTDKSNFNEYAKYLKDEQLVAWFGSNLTLEHNKTIPIPIGLANRYWNHFRGFNGNTQLIENTIKHASGKRHILLYMNFNPDTNKKARNSVLQIFLNKKFCYNSRRVFFRCYIHQLAQSKFVASPPGNGIDCHRTWEALYLGAIPIVSSTQLNRMYKDLPVIIVDDWSTITETFLHTKYKEIQNKQYRLEKLTTNYWIKKIAHYKEKATLEANVAHNRFIESSIATSIDQLYFKTCPQTCLTSSLKNLWAENYYPHWSYTFWHGKNKLFQTT